MCVITSLVATGTTAMIIGSVVEAAAIAGVAAAGTTAAMGGEAKDIWKSGLIGAGFGAVGGAAGAAGGALAGSLFGASAGAAGGAAGGATAGAAGGATGGTAGGLGGGMLANITATPSTLGAFLGGVSGAAGGISTTAQNTAALQEAKAEQEMLNQQAKLDEQKAAIELENAQIEKMDQRRKAHQLQGQGRVAAAANGVMLESDREESLANMWEQDVAIETAYDNAKIQHNAEISAWGYRENARLKRYQGRQLVKGAKKNAITSTFVGLGTTALSSFGSSFASGTMGVMGNGLGKGAGIANGINGIKTTDSYAAETLYGGVGLRMIA